MPFISTIPWLWHLNDFVFGSPVRLSNQMKSISITYNIRPPANTKLSNDIISTEEAELQIRIFIKLDNNNWSKLIKWQFIESL